MEYSYFKKCIEDAMIDVDLYTFLKDLSKRVYLERDVAPWSIAFKDICINRPDKDQLIEILQKLCKEEQLEVCFGSLILLLEVGDVYSLRSFLLDILINRQENDLKDYRSLLYFKLLDTLIMQENMELVPELINLINTDSFLKDLVDDLGMFINIPFKEMFKELAMGNFEYYERVLFFISQDKIRISRIANSFLNVYISSNHDQQGNLLKVIDQIATKSKNPRYADFVSQVLDLDDVYKDYVKQYKWLASEHLTGIAFGTENEAIRRSTKRIVKNYKQPIEPSVLLAARGNIGNLSKDALVLLVREYLACKDDMPLSVRALKEQIPVDNTDPDVIAFFVQKITNIKELPISIGEIVDSFGIQIREIILPNDDFDGCILRSEGLFFPIIILNKAHGPEKRNRFTIAHELAHYLLPGHENFVGTCLTEWNDNGNQQAEREADKLAAALLMPKQKIIEDAQYGIGNWNRIEKLVSKYDVSKIAVAARILEFINEPPSILFRFENGICNLAWFSQNFPVDYNVFPNRGHSIPQGSGAERIANGNQIEFEGDLPLESWTVASIPRRISQYKVHENSITSGANWILTLVELLEPDEEDNHVQYRREGKKFGFDTFYGK